jgi:hypothetical protein
MDVYLIPVGSPGTDRYELYCDDAGDAETLVGDVQPAGWFASLAHKFKTALAYAERQRLSGANPDDRGPRTWIERIKDRGMGWMAERIAEQRLLWRLRNETDLRLFYPDDLDEAAAVAVARGDLQREADRHLKWTIIDGGLFVASGVIFFVPGPNIVAYYFGFRLVGHYLSRRGAKHGLNAVSWQACASPELSRLRRAIALAGKAREREVHDVAAALQLPHLARFFERTSVRTA